MRIDAVQTEAESTAIHLIEQVRRDVVLAIVAAKTIDTHSGIRYQVRDIIHGHMDYVANKFWQFYESAWDVGVERGGSLSKTPGSTITRQLARFEEITTNAFRSLTQAMESDISTALSRAALGALTKDEVLQKIGTSTNAGFFKGYQARAVGIVEYEVFQIEGFASRLRAIEVAEQGQKQPDAIQHGPNSTTVGGAKSANDVLVFVTMWQHNESGNPRENHIEMDGKYVITGTNFRLITKDGTPIMCSGPYAANLPIGEIANCRCATIPQVFKTTPQKKAELEAKSAATGGFRDPLFDGIATPVTSIATSTPLAAQTKKTTAPPKKTKPKPEAELPAALKGQINTPIEASVPKAKPVSAAKQKVAIGTYTGGSHIEINGYLRKTEIATYDKSLTQTQIDGSIATLDKMMGAVPKELKGKSIYRGIKNPDRIDQLSVGNVISDDGFMSASVEERVGRDFAQGGGQSEKSEKLGGYYVLRIKLEGSERCVDLRGKGKFPNEMEILLDRGSSLKIDGFEKKYGGEYVFVDCHVE